MTKEADEIREYYDTFLASEPGKYSSLAEFNARYEPVLSFFRETGEWELKILDVGCGTGMTAVKLKEFGTVCGVDISPKSIKQARSRLDKAYACPAEELPFQDGVFDVVVCTETIEHTLSPVRALFEFHRVLKQGGHLILSTPNPRYWLILLSKVYAKLSRRAGGTGQIVEHYLPHPELKRLLRMGGFGVVEFRTVFYKPFFVKWIPCCSGLYQIYIAKKLREGIR